MSYQPLSLTLLPSGEEETGLRELIERLAEEHNAPVFSPHLTVYTGCYEGLENDAEELVSSLAETLRPFSLTVNGVYSSEVIYRTAALCFDPHSHEVLNVSEAAAKLFPSTSYQLRMPHLSILYSQLDVHMRKQICAELYANWFGRTLTFDRFEIVYPPFGEENADEPFKRIRDWRLSFSIYLGSRG